MSIEISNLAKHFGTNFTLEVPSFSLTRGSTLGLVGNNGAGKTTFLRLILDLMEADEGEVKILGETVAERDDWKTHVGSYLDASFLFDYLTPREFFGFVGSMYNMKMQDIEKALDPYRTFLANELAPERHRYIRDLSTGSAKKVGIISAMIINPKVLILDEPFANLDPRSQLALKSILQELAAQRKVTMVISSHDLAHVTDVCERIAILERGRIVEDMQTSKQTLSTLEAYFADV